jgi:primosomal replication protein N
LTPSVESSPAPASAVVARDPVRIANRVELMATLQATEGLRYTPGGIAVVDAVMKHVSEQREAGVTRSVELEAAVRFSGPLAQRASAMALGSTLLVRGFLAPRRRQSKQLVVHVNEFELIEV